MASRSSEQSYRHVVSLGCRCSQASIYKALGERRYAGPFDWIFSSAAIVFDCLQDNFRLFLDREQYFLNATVFDAIGLPPGSAPRERKLIGHRTYSEMMENVGKGTIFNHRNPLDIEEDYQYLQRCVERFRLVLACRERKLFVILNLNHQLWIEDDIHNLFLALGRQTDNFLLVALNCSEKNRGPSALQIPIEERANVIHGDHQLLMYSVQLYGDNTGSYFRNDQDATLVKSILVDPYDFQLASDPLRNVQLLHGTREAVTGPSQNENDLPNSVGQMYAVNVASDSTALTGGRSRWRSTKETTESHKATVTTASRRRWSTEREPT